MTELKRFILLKHDNSILHFQSRTAREAALKAASKDEKEIILFESDKLYVYEGDRKILTEEEQNAFTQKNRIKYKPIVAKLHYEKLNRTYDLKSEKDLAIIRSILNTTLF